MMFDDMMNDFELAASRGLFLVTIEARSKRKSGDRPEQYRVFANATPKVGEIIVLSGDQRAEVTEVRHAMVQNPPLKLPLLAIFVSVETVPSEGQGDRRSM
jgi:hypothetical protein